MYKTLNTPYGVDANKLYYEEKTQLLTYSNSPAGGAYYDAQREADGKAACYVRRRPASRKKPVFNILADWYFCVPKKIGGYDSDSSLKKLWKHLSKHGGPIYVFLGNEIEQAHSLVHLSELVKKIIPAKPTTVLEIAFNQLKQHYPNLTNESINLLDYFVNNNLDHLLGLKNRHRNGSPFTDLPALHIGDLRGMSREMFQLIMNSIPENFQFGIVIRGKDDNTVINSTQDDYDNLYARDDCYQLSPTFLAELLQRFSHNIFGIALLGAEGIFPALAPILMSYNPQHVKQIILQTCQLKYKRAKTIDEQLLAFIAYFSHTESLTLDCDSLITDIKALARLTKLRIIHISGGDGLYLTKLVPALPKLEAITLAGSFLEISPVLEALANSQVKSLHIENQYCDQTPHLMVTTKFVYPHITTFMLTKYNIDLDNLVFLLASFPNLETIIFNDVDIIQQEISKTLVPLNLSKLKYLEIKYSDDYDDTAPLEWLNNALKNAHQLITLKLYCGSLDLEMEHFPLLQILHLTKVTLTERVLLGFDKLFSLKDLTFVKNEFSTTSRPPTTTAYTFPALMYACIEGSIPQTILTGVLQQAPQLQYLNLNTNAYVDSNCHLPNLRQLQLEGVNNIQHVVALLLASPCLEELTIDSEIPLATTLQRITTLNHLLRITLNSFIPENLLHNLLDAAPNLITFSYQPKHECPPSKTPLNKKIEHADVALLHLYSVKLINVSITSDSLQRLLQRFIYTRHLNLIELKVLSTLDHRITFPLTWINLRYYRQISVSFDLSSIITQSPQLLSLVIKNNDEYKYENSFPLKLSNNLNSIIDIELINPTVNTLKTLLENTSNLKRFSVSSYPWLSDQKPFEIAIATTQLVSYMGYYENLPLLTAILTTQQATLQTLNLRLASLPYISLSLTKLQNLQLNISHVSEKNSIYPWSNWIQNSKYLQSVNLSGPLDAKLLEGLPKDLITLQLDPSPKLNPTECTSIKSQWPHAIIKLQNSAMYHDDPKYYEPGFESCGSIRNTNTSSGLSLSSWSNSTAAISNRNIIDSFDNDFKYDAKTTTLSQYFSSSSTIPTLITDNKGAVREASAGAHDTNRVAIEIKQSSLERLRTTFTTLSDTKRGEMGWYEDMVCVSEDKDAPLASFSERDTILEIYTSEPVKLLYCTGEARYYISSPSLVPISCQIAAIVHFKFCPYKVNPQVVIPRDIFLNNLFVSSDINGNLTLPPQFKTMARERFIDSLVNAIQKFDAIKDKPDVPPPPSARYTAALCNYMLQWKIGYCRQRVWLFKLIMQAYDPSIEVQFSGNSNHAFVHIRLAKTDGLQRIDLGGDGSNQQNVEIFKLPLPEKEEKISSVSSTSSTSFARTAAALSEATAPLAKLDAFKEFYKSSITQLTHVQRKLGSRFVANILWYCQNERQLELFEHLMENYFRSHHHSYCYIQDLADISGPIPSYSEFGQFLKTAMTGSILVINLTKMHLGQNAIANSMLELKRRVGATSINSDIYVIALLPEAMQYHHSADLFRRFVVEETIPHHLQALIDPLDMMSAPSVDAKALPLFHSEEILGSLLGRTVFENGERIHQPGILQPYLQADNKSEVKEATKIEIALENMPLDNAEARHALRRLLPRDGLPGQVFIDGKQHTLLPCVTLSCQQSPYDFSSLKHVTAELATATSLALCQFVLTPEHLKTFIPPHYSADETLHHWHKTPSLFEQEAGKTIIIRVRPGVYSMAAWARFFASATHHAVTLRLILDRGIVIPTLPLKIQEEKHHPQSNVSAPTRGAKATLQVIITTQPHRLVKNLLAKKLIAITDYYPLNPNHTAADVIGSYATFLNCDGKRKVMWQTAAIAKKLCEGKFVVIENISADLAQALATLLATPPHLLMNNKIQLVSGRLLILCNNVNLFPSILDCYKDTTEYKNTDEKTIVIATPTTAAETKEDVIDENQQRLQAIDRALQNNSSRSVYVQGETGTGKTTSIREYSTYYKEKYNQTLNVWTGLENLLAFLEAATSNPDPKKNPCMLHIDEANTLEEGELGVFESLHNPIRPGIHLQQNEFFDLQPNMHFVFSGNPKNYGRNAHAFLDDHPEIVISFKPFSKAYIQQHQYFPWLQQLMPTLASSQYTAYINYFMDAEAFIKPHLQKALTPRNREMICLRLLLLREKGINNAECLAAYQELEALIDESRKTELQQYLFTTVPAYQACITPLQQHMVKNIAAYCVVNNFYPVSSRQSIIVSLLQLLDLADYRCKHPTLHSMGIRGVVLEGPTDGGKTQLITLLHALRTHNVTTATTATSTTSVSEDELIFLDPNDPDLDKKLEQAYDLGKKLLIDESNTIINPRAYEKALNYYLTDLPHSRLPQVREGSFAFFTQNPASGYKNRYSFSPALMNRLSFLTVPWFTRQDLTEIIYFLNVKPSVQTETLIKSYLDSTVAARHRFTINEFIEGVKILSLTDNVSSSTSSSSNSMYRANTSVFFAASRTITPPTPAPVKKPPSLLSSVVESV